MASIRNRGVAFDCAICKTKLSSQGPQLCQLSFGKLFDRPEERTPATTALLLNQFPGYEAACQRYALEHSEDNARIVYDCNKIMVTPCGHLFHSGCLREWYFTTRHCNPFGKCPFCNQLAALGECILAYPIESAVDSSSSSESLLIKTKVHVQRRGGKRNMSGVTRSTRASRRAETDDDSDIHSMGSQDVGVENDPNLAVAELQEDRHYLRHVKMLTSISKLCLALFFSFSLCCLVYINCNHDDELEDDLMPAEDEPIFFGYYWICSVVLAAICSIFVERSSK